MFYNSKGLSIYYETFGNGENSIIILPGWGNTRNTFYNIINYFKDNYKIYIFDYPGFGKSPVPDNDLTIYDYANIIAHFIKTQNISNPIVIAHSFGGRITSILCAIHNINFKKIILIDVAGIKRRKKIKVIIREKIYKLLKKITYFFPKDKRLLFQKKLLLHFASPDYNDIPLCMKKTFKNIISEDLSKYYKEIISDTLILWGNKDYDTPLKDGIFLEKNIKNSALIKFRNASHFSYLYNPYLINKIIDIFISN